MQRKKKKPFWIWLISAFYLFAGVASLFSLLGIVASPQGIPQEMRSKALGWTLWGMIPLLNIIGAFSLFRMKKAAHSIFCAILGLGLANALLRALFDPDPLLTGSNELIGTALGYVILVLVCIYTYNLKKHGALT